ncbi:MAG: PD-(D/E)XK nuclease family protein [Elusimicrobia bacterium]|nr:PD-(D/E)XK nuclease family protein [Elusimicrobiota bacterium]
MEVDSSTRFSFSKLDTYKGCPRRYRYRYVDKIVRERRTVETFLGECVHGALEELYGRLQHGKTSSLDEILAVFGAKWKAGWSPEIVIHDKALSADDFKRVGEDCLRTYFGAHAPFSDDRSHEVEKKLGLSLAVDVDGTALECRIEGYLDRLSFPKEEPEAVEIHDYKTGGHLPTQEVVDANFQFDVYDLLVRSQYPRTKEVRVLLHYLRFNRVLSPSRDPRLDQTAKTRAVLESLIRSVRRDHAWEPHKSQLCDWCEYRDICPLWAHVEKVKALSSAAARKDDGVRLVDELGGLEEKKKDLKDELRRLEKVEEGLRALIFDYAGALMAAEGEKTFVVSGTEGEAVVSEKEELKFPTKTHAPDRLRELEGLLKDMAVWRDVSRVDTGLLVEGAKARRWDPEVLRAVEALIERFGRLVREKHLRFRRKKGEEEPG